MSIESPKYFVAGDAGGSPEKNNEQKQAPEKKEIKIDPNNFDEEEIEKIFKDQETTETTKTAKEEKPEEPQQTPEQQLKDEVEKFFVEQVQADRHFFSKDITPKEFRTWQEITQTDFKTFSEEKQKILMEMLANELGKNSNLIENAQKDLESKTIDKKEKDEIKKGLKEYLQPLQKAIRARTQVYHLALHPEKPPENTKIKEQLHGLIEKAAVVFYSKEVDPNERIKLMGEYSTQIAKLLNMPPASIYLTELIADSKKQNQSIDKISGLVDKAKEIPKPEVIKKAAEFVKNEEKKGKESIFQKMGGWNTVGGIAGFSLMMFLILVFLGEFKLLEKATGIKMEGGGKGEKK